MVLAILASELAALSIALDGAARRLEPPATPQGVDLGADAEQGRHAVSAVWLHELPFRRRLWPGEGRHRSGPDGHAFIRRPNCVSTFCSLPPASRCRVTRDESPTTTWSESSRSCSSRRPFAGRRSSDDVVRLRDADVAIAARALRMRRPNRWCIRPDPRRRRSPGCGG